LLFSSLDISMYTISLAGSNSENLEERANTWVTAPAAAPATAMAPASSPPRLSPWLAASDRPKKPAPASSMMAGVAEAAAIQPRSAGGETAGGGQDGRTAGREQAQQAQQGRL
jgi:hypothetical protein